MESLKSQFSFRSKQFFPPQNHRKCSVFLVCMILLAVYDKYDKW